jgi:hypothetical protein
MTRLFALLRRNQGTMVFVFLVHFTFVAMSVLSDSLGIRGALGFAALFIGLGMWTRAIFLYGGDSYYLPLEIRAMNASPDRANDTMALVIAIDVFVIIAISSLV